MTLRRRRLRFSRRERELGRRLWDGGLRNIVETGIANTTANITMSSDGCQTPAWTGQSFAHLRYQPAPVSSYADARKAHAGALLLTVAMHLYVSRTTSIACGTQMQCRRRLNDVRCATVDYASAPIYTHHTILGSHWHMGRPSTPRRPPCSVPTPRRARQRPTHAVPVWWRCIAPCWCLCTRPDRGTAPVCTAGPTAPVHTPILCRDHLQRGWTHLVVHSADAQQLATAAAVLAGVPRESLFLSLLVHNAGPEAVRSTATHALRTLGVQHVDVLVLEWPAATDHATKVRTQQACIPHVPTSVFISYLKAPLDHSTSATWAACSALVAEGLAQRLGVAHWSLPEVEALLTEAGARPAVCFLELHPLLPQRKLVGVCLRKVRVWM